MDSYLNRPAWTIPEKMVFRFIFLFFSLFIIIFNNGGYPFVDVLMFWPTEALHVFVPWFAKSFLHLGYDISVFTNGSGDTSYDYVCLFIVFLTSLIGFIVWSLLDRKRNNYYRLYYWLTVAVRFYVGLMLINYGLYKVIKLQFPFPGPNRLTQQYGNSSPMGLAWTFLGFSKGYNLFMGLAEVSAVLLLFRRTVAVGAIIALMTTANVMAVNYFYDVPVKILSTSLLVFTLFLLSPNFATLFNLFFKAKNTGLNLIAIPPLRNKWLRYSLRGIKVLTLCYSAYAIYDLHEMSKEYGDSGPKPPLYGAYNVLSYRSSKTKDQADIAGDTRWRQFIVEYPEHARARLVADSSYDYRMNVDTSKKQITINTSEDSVHHYTLNYELQKNELTLHGVLAGDTVMIRMKRKDPKDFRLTGRGFHWISEHPYNK